MKSNAIKTWRFGDDMSHYQVQMKETIKRFLGNILKRILKRSRRLVGPFWCFSLRVFLVIRSYFSSFKLRMRVNKDIWLALLTKWTRQTSNSPFKALVFKKYTLEGERIFRFVWHTSKQHIWGVFFLIVISHCCLLQSLSTALVMILLYLCSCIRLHRNQCCRCIWEILLC